MATIDLTEREIPEWDEALDPQTFAPTPRVEKPRVPKHHRVRLPSLEGLRDRAKNRYEAVLIAAARARQLNAKKVALEERGMEEALELKRLKITSHALTELIEGKIDVQRPDVDM